MNHDKEREIVLIIEYAQLELKKIIQSGILLDLPKEQLKVMTLDLINITKEKLKQAEADDDLIQDTEFAIKRSFILWYNNLYAQLKKTDYKATSRVYHGKEQPIKPEIVKDKGGYVITGEQLRRESIGNLREYQTIISEGGAGYYYNYTERVQQAMDELAKQHLTMDKYSLRNRAEIKVRYDVINEDMQRLKDKGVKFISMEDVLAEFYNSNELQSDRESHSKMYVLTNKEKYLGAVLIYFSEIMTEIAQILGDDFYLLPASIHEWIIIPESAVNDRMHLLSVVRNINCYEVLEEEVLSNDIYLYSRKSQMNHFTCISDVD